jgi:ATP-binding cassette subfamily B protein/subfamily B ATP-binding cassette protein MsbA
MSLKDLRTRIALVTQSTELFNRTVMENILYGNPDATEEDAIEAAVMAHADEFIRNQLKDGYNTVVGTGGQFLSGGQRQRIALARALLRKPEILILDESTSQIDMTSELLIRESLGKLRGRQTILIITHREALLELADKIYEMQDGQLVPTPSYYQRAA